MDVVVKKSEISGVAEPPPSKSYTHRAFIAASLSGKAKIHNALISEDTLATINGCKKIGAKMQKKDHFLVFGTEDLRGGYFYFANSGTTLRIFTALLSMSKDVSTLDGDESLRSRPNRELALAIRELGGKVFGDELFRAPIKVSGIMKGGDVSLKALSSQFVTALLFSLPLAKFESTVKAEVKSKPYLDVTMHVLKESCVKVEFEGDKYFIYPSNFRLREFFIPSDFSSASYLIAAGILSGKVEIRNMYDSMLGDKKIVDVCREMGGKVEWDKENGVIRAERSELEGIDFDASDTPDLVPTVAMLATVAKGVTKIRNAEHLRIKETDRIKVICENLSKLGFKVKEYRDGMEIVGRSGKFFGTVDSAGDHRIAMAFSLLGLLGEIKIKNAEVVSVSYPGYFDTLKSLGAQVLTKNF
ncbi:MAG: 3-phosphoshikimate 1-carboxyvinyltransferase [Archaeoglobaceae archaeon]|nr:3-phosphoshikimate 1-carboxyvinyltransferase [Archaeoglobaceae archaeon]MCX8151467.1 3-phosphoshikimate 1-carboxyvinyltransferase [Archaeoglobaceae archaeon]MDW8014229.1 3-phosphoshikimate 1-carboxyvinyltransferase [Archaeoglobaceae archaeon]